MYYKVAFVVLVILIVGYIVYRKKEGLVSFNEYYPYTQGLNTSNVGGDYASSIVKLSDLERATI